MLDIKNSKVKKDASFKFEIIPPHKVICSIRVACRERFFLQFIIDNFLTFSPRCALSLQLVGPEWAWTWVPGSIALNLTCKHFTIKIFKKYHYFIVTPTCPRLLVLAAGMDSMIEQVLQKTYHDHDLTKKRKKYNCLILFLQYY